MGLNKSCRASRHGVFSVSLLDMLPWIKSVGGIVVSKLVLVVVRVRSC